ncbi:Single-stranded TG1-3 DNA-binding protein [Ceratocystis lukuohia]|uniref:Single-stranded TG1-3 DNA-binding protein n=2 Tax=Ceratocystis TaxID=5157 RepID=A0A0F8CT92_CERFI|nr:Single-stranded TG1-3 DNA-binding protein [Ceratocystis platani]
MSAAAADAATNGVAAVTEPATVAEEKTNTPTTTTTDAPQDQSSVAEGRRLYLGNVAYAATEEALKEFFQGFDVKSVSIPKNPHTNKSVGYAFVDVATPEEAQRAISELDRKQIMERKVSVQVARPPQESTGDSAEPRRQANGRAGGRTRRRAQGKKDDKSATTTDGAAQATSAANDDESAANKEAKPTKSRSPKRKTHKGPPDNGVQSKVKVMVTNLPYNLTEEQLKELFSAFTPVSAKVALRPIPSYMIKKLHARGEARKGRGFGFVTLETEELQKKAIEEMNNKMVEGRMIEVKVAIDSPDKVERPADGEEEKKEAAAPVETAPESTAVSA